MPEVRVLKIVFDTEIKPHEVPKFRGAVIEVAGRERVAFHNHLNDSKFHYQYPVIQYKTHGRKAGIVCVEDGVDEIHHFFMNNKGQVRIGSTYKDLHVESVKINSFKMEVGSKIFSYRLRSWLPLNEKNYPRYQSLSSLAEKLSFLEKVLVGNILSFAKGLQWQVDQPIQVSLQDIPSQKWIKHKGISFLSFDIAFDANVRLPLDIGLGKGASLGFGTVYKN